jgi:tyrosine-protein phosphatase SIW14
MIRKRSQVWLFSCLFAVTLFFGTSSCWSQDQQHSGLPNFGVVSDALFRGAQPSSTGFASLKHMGVGIVVNFREEADETSKEKSQVEALGMKYVGIPWSGNADPSNAQIVQFLDLVRANPTTKIFVHCKAGADRTGTMVAAYRVAMDHKTVADALSEMHSFHYHHFFLPQLERWVNTLPNLLKSDAVFAAYSPVLAPAAAAASAAATVAPPTTVAAGMAAPMLAGAR